MLVMVRHLQSRIITLKTNRSSPIADDALSVKSFLFFLMICLLPQELSTTLLRTAFVHLCLPVLPCLSLISLSPSLLLCHPSIPSVSSVCLSRPPSVIYFFLVFFFHIPPPVRLPLSGSCLLTQRVEEEREREREEREKERKR